MPSGHFDWVQETVELVNDAQSAGESGADVQVFLKRDAIALHYARVVPMVKPETIFVRSAAAAPRVINFFIFRNIYHRQ